jgi:hypothetical protein
MFVKDVQREIQTARANIDAAIEHAATCPKPPNGKTSAMQPKPNWNAAPRAESVCPRSFWRQFKL